MAYVAGIAGGPELPPPGAALHQYFNDHVCGLPGCLYGGRTYEVMRYWDEDRPVWGAVEHDFAAAWRARPKWVASRSLKSIGFRPFVLGRGKPYFAGARPPLRMIATAPIGEDAVRLTDVPA